MAGKMLCCKSIARGDAVAVGDVVICDGEHAEVLRVIEYGPGAHPRSPIWDRLAATEFVTARGSRWRGYDYIPTNQQEIQ